MKNNDSAFLIAGIWALVIPLAQYAHNGFLGIIASALFGIWIFNGITRTLNDL